MLHAGLWQRVWIPAFTSKTKRIQGWAGSPWTLKSFMRWESKWHAAHILRWKIGHIWLTSYSCLIITWLMKLIVRTSILLGRILLSYLMRHITSRLHVKKQLVFQLSRKFLKKSWRSLPNSKTISNKTLTSRYNQLMNHSNILKCLHNHFGNIWKTTI